MLRFNRSTFKSTLAGVTAVLLTLGIGVTAASAAMPDTVNLTVHYQRTDGDYTGWDVYTWKNMNSGSDGASTVCAFSATDDFGALATCPEITGLKDFDSLGFLIRKGGSSWSAKDTKDDRFILPDKISATGKAEIWLKTGDPTIYFEAPKVEPVTPKISTAVIDDLNVLTVTLNSQVALPSGTDRGFTVTGPNAATVAVTQVTPLNGPALKDPAGTTSKVKLTLASNLDLGLVYTVSNPSLNSVSATAGNVYDTAAFEAAYTYAGNDLGNTYSAAKTDFRVWAPTASSVSLMKFTSATGTLASATEVPMTASTKGTWVASVAGDQHGLVYQYKVVVGGVTRYAADPYARSVTKQGARAVVVDLAKTNPAGWENDKNPNFGRGNTDAIIYELQIRDLSMDSSSGISDANKGKFLGLTENNTSTSFSVTSTVTKKGKKVKVTKKYSTPTGVAAIKDLGVTHVQLLPIYDFASGGDEASPVFNWGYDPENYNAPEGGFSSNPSDPVARIRELKTAIANLHNQGLGTIMDVVYNHVYDANGFSFEQIVPGYFFRREADGTLISGLGVGNEVASERSMVRKFIVDSATYWAKEYHLDGYRFDLMGSLDVTTMNQIRASVDAINPKFIVLGEGWKLGSPKDPANQSNAERMPNIAHFNDQFRDGAKGSVFDAADRGFINGDASGGMGDVKAGIVGNTRYPGVAPRWFTDSPGQSVNYVEAHDNLTLYDKIQASMNKPPAAQTAAVVRMAGALVMLSQGVPFMQAGQEFLRSKGSNDNSYNASDAVNSLKWKQRALNASTVSYYKGLIALRKAHPVFRLDSTDAVVARLKFVSGNMDGTVSYVLDGSGLPGESWNTTYVAFNPTASAYTFKLPSKGDWQVVVNGTKAGVTTIQTLKGVSEVKVPAGATFVLHN